MTEHDVRCARLRYDDVALFYAGATAREKRTLYGVFGGTPRHHALLDPARPPTEQVIDLLLRPRAPLESELAFRGPVDVWRERIEPHLSEYLGGQVFEGVCGQRPQTALSGVRRASRPAGATAGGALSSDRSQHLHLIGPEEILPSSRSGRAGAAFDNG